MLKLALETLRVQTTYQDYEASYQLERAGILETRWHQAKWSASDGVADLFAGVYAAAGDLDKAIAWYDRAIAVADGNVSMRALEQRTNLQVRQAWAAVEAARARSTARTGRKTARKSTALDAARATIREGTKVLGELMAFRPTAERANLCGSAMKRLAQVEAAAGRPREEVRGIEEMKRYYKLGQELCAQDGLPDLFYPASNYIAAELALNAGRKGWRIGDRSLFDVTRRASQPRTRTSRTSGASSGRSTSISTKPSRRRHSRRRARSRSRPEVR
jgi:tetratricopeptide (TPR) repeat protein